MISNHHEREARDQGYRDTMEQALKLHGIIRSKFKPGKWVQKQGNSWTEVFPYGKPTDVEMDEALPLDQLRKAAGVKATNPFANAPKPIEPIKPAQIPTGPVDLNQFKPKNESATVGATSAANIGTVDAPHISPGKARGKKSYTGSPGKSGSKAPPQPKVNQPKNKDGTAKNGLDIKGASLFGGPPIKRR